MEIVKFIGTDCFIVLFVLVVWLDLVQKKIVGEMVKKKLKRKKFFAPFFLKFFVWFVSFLK